MIVPVRLPVRSMRMLVDVYRHSRLNTLDSVLTVIRLSDSNLVTEVILYSQKFSSAKNFVKSDRQAVSSEIYFRQTSVVTRLLLRSFGRSSFAYRSSSHEYF